MKVSIIISHFDRKSKWQMDAVRKAAKAIDPSSSAECGMMDAIQIDIEKDALSKVDDAVKGIPFARVEAIIPGVGVVTIK